MQRQMIRLWLVGLSLWTMAAAAAAPNIVLILADDLGWSDLGCYGGEIRTPHLDALAAGGVRFTRFYNTSRCCPTRASLLTGLYPHQAGVGAMNHDAGPQHPGYRGTLQPQTVTLAEALKEAGYRTLMVGKWHLHNRLDVKPTDRGFEEFYGMLGGYNSFWHESPHYTRLPAGRPVRVYTAPAGDQPGTFYATDAFADYAEDFIRPALAERKPFFLYLAFNAPHFPLHAPEADIARYEGLYYAQGWDGIRAERLARQKQMGLVPADLALPPRSEVVPKLHARPSPFAGRPNPAWAELPEERRRDLARRMAVYAAMVERMDGAIGRVMKVIQAAGAWENTVVLFLSDNGACWEWDPYGFDESSGPQNRLHRGEELKQVGGPGSYISYGSGWANACNTPWRLYKHFSHEGGIRTPCIVHWPRQLRRGGRLTDFPGHVMDLMPTLLAAAQARYPAERNGVKTLPLEGVNLWPALMGRVNRRAGPLFFEHEGSRAVMEGRWKLVAQWGGPWELYDLQTDAVEMQDLSRQMPYQTRRLAAMWEGWAARCHVNLALAEAAWGSGGASGSPAASPQIAGRALRIRAEVETQAAEGVILAQGGRQQGYALHLRGGRPVFSVRINGQVHAIEAGEAVGGRFLVEARLARDGAMTLAVNGTTVAEGRAAGVIPAQPVDPLTVGEDTETAVGAYTPPHRLPGTVKNVVVETE
ncbi:MAG: arylsulfatase [Verrucomicrobiae bacterium]|nr:arylsulfatase [Verrucomicrobiae bacterium]